MYTTEELYSALRKADAAGDKEAARRLTQYIQAQSSQATATQEPKGPETAGMGEAFMGGAKRMLGSMETGVSGLFGAEEAAKAGQARQEAITERPGASLEKVKDVYHKKGFFPAAREALSEVPTAVSEQFPNLATTLTSARLGAMGGAELGLAGGPFAEVTVPVGAVLGGLGGAFLPSYLQQAGSNLERQAQEGKPISAGAAYSAAVPQAALDVFTDKVMFSKLMGLPVKALGRAEADAVVAKSLKRTLAEGTVKGVAAEVPTEVAQQMLERYQAGLSLTDEDARKEYAATAYQTALLGPLGAIGTIQERGEAKAKIAKDEAEKAAAALQAQRRATGVMEQQPLFTPAEAPIPEPTTTMPGQEPISTVAPEEAPVEQPVPEGQGELFTPRGAPTAEAKASVEAARVQGLPAQIQQLMQTPEGRAELAANMKAYFPDLSVQERNKIRPQIQQATYMVEPVAAPEGTLTPDVLKAFDITPRSKQYAALEGAHLSDPTTYNLLTTAAATNTDFGVKANRLLEAYPHYNPNAAQPDLFGVPNAPQTQAQAEPIQQDFFGVPEDRTNVVEPGSEQGVGQPVQQQAAEAPQVEKPVGRGVDVLSQPTDGNIGQPAGSTENQPSALAPVPKKVAREAAAALKKEPVATTWEYFSDTPFAKLSKIAKDKVKDAHAQGYLNQELADDIERIEVANLAKTNVANKIASGSPEMAAQLTARKLDEAIEVQKDLEADSKATQAKKDAAAKKVAKIQKQLEKLSSEESTRGNEPMTLAEENAYVNNALQGKSPVEAARWIAENIPDKARKAVAEAVANQLARFEAAGFQMQLHIVGKGTELYNKLRPNANGAMGFENKDLTKPYIILKNITANESAGTNFRTVLHELTHMATRVAVSIGKQNNDPHVNRLNDILKVVRDEVTARESRGENLSEFAKRALDKKNNAFENVDELIAWTAASPDMQELMESIKLNNKKSLWSEFVTTIRSLLGIPASAETALSEILSSTEQLLNKNVKKLYSAANLDYLLEEVDPAEQARAQQFISGMSGTLNQSVPTATVTPAQAAQNFVNTAYRNPTGALGMIENMINQVRTRGIDKAAHLSASIQDHNDGAFYNVNGQMRADLLMSAANNTNNYINAVFTLGDIDILPNGAVEAKHGTHSVDNIFRHAKALADRIGVEQMRQLVTNTFYHYRAKAIIDNLPRDQWPENWLKDPRMVPTQAQINAAMAAFNAFPELRAMQREFIGSKNQMVKFLRKAGFLTQEKADAFLRDDSYAPWLRLKEYQDTLPGLGNMGKMVDLQQMKALVGGTEEVNDMLENMAQMIGWCVRSGVSNHTANSALNTMTSMGTATRHAGRPGGVNPAHVVMTYTDGKPTFWTVDNPYDLAAFQSVKGLNSPTMKAIGKALGTLRAGIVLFPAFPLRQVVMDSQRAFVESGVDKPWAMMGKIYKSFLSGEAFRGQHADIQKLMQYGVVGGADFTAMDTTRGRAHQFGVGGKHETITDKWVHHPAYNFLHKLAYSADLAVRLGIYRQTMEETGDETLAATRAREIINFQKAGTSELVHTLKQTIPFLGAYLQGMDVNYRSMVGRGNSMKARKAAAKAYWGNMAMYAGLVIAYTMAMSGDDEYEDQKGPITDRNFLIPGTKLMLPVPTDVGFLAKVVPERITDYVLQEGTDSPESARRLRQGIVQAFGAGYLPPAAVYGVTPAIELMLNKSFFSDMPIVSQRLQGIDPQFQYTASTSGLAKQIGEITGQSPLQIDYIFNAIGGTSAGALLQLADVSMGSTKMASDKYPIVSSFQQKTVGGRNAEEYYALRDMSDKAYNTANQLAVEQNPEKLQEYLADPKKRALISMHDSVEALHAQLNEVSHSRNVIENDPNLSPEEKRQRVNELMANVEAALRAMPIRKIRAENE